MVQYVTDETLYVSPYSSVLYLDGDNGMRYTAEGNTFTVVRRDTDKTVYRYGDMDWVWTDFPYSDSQWRSFFVLIGDYYPVNTTPNATYDTLRWCQVGGDLNLVQADGELWLLELVDGSREGLHARSLFKLKVEPI